MTITVTIEKKSGGYLVKMGEEQAVASTKRQAANRVKELVQEALEKAEK